jgi:hypothetical protein
MKPRTLSVMVEIHENRLPADELRNIVAARLSGLGFDIRRVQVNVIDATKGTKKGKGK